MNRITILAVAFGSVVLSECVSAKEIEPKVTIRASGYTQEDVIKAIAAFRKACKPLGNNSMWSDIVEIHGDLAEEYAQFRLDRGWKATLHLQLRLPDKLRNIPEYNQETGVINGHTLHYHLGGGHTPGFFATKRVSQFLCGLRVDQKGADVFADVPEMAVLNRK